MVQRDAVSEGDFMAMTDIAAPRPTLMLGYGLEGQLDATAIKGNFVRAYGAVPDDFRILAISQHEPWVQYDPWRVLADTFDETTLSGEEVSLEAVERVRSALDELLRQVHAEEPVVRVLFFVDGAEPHWVPTFVACATEMIRAARNRASLEITACVAVSSIARVVGVGATNADGEVDPSSRSVGGDELSRARTAVARVTAAADQIGGNLSMSLCALTVDEFNWHQHSSLLGCMEFAAAMSWVLRAGEALDPAVGLSAHAYGVSDLLITKKLPPRILPPCEGDGQVALHPDYPAEDGSGRAFQMAVSHLEPVELEKTLGEMYRRAAPRPLPSSSGGRIAAELGDSRPAVVAVPRDLADLIERTWTSAGLPEAIVVPSDETRRISVLRSQTLELAED